MKFVFFACLLSLLTLSLLAQETPSASDKEAAYTKTVTARAEKIVTSLDLADAAKRAAVTELVADQYKALNAVYSARDEQLKKAKESISEKEALSAKLKAIDETTAAQTHRLHTDFLETLSKHLSEEQITKIKDGLTYNVLNVTYTAMLDMIPSLKPAEKEQIMTWLVEAREQAMDAESSEKKHWWFGKYKGRINNYLAAQGYDLQKERAAWELRIKARDEQKKQAQTN